MQRTVLLITGLLAITNVMACADNEYEQCWSVDLGPLGTAKDCKCLPKVDVGRVPGTPIPVPVPVPSGQGLPVPTPGTISDETRRAISNLARELGKTPEAIQECMNDVPRCANEIVSAPLALPVQAYIDGLYRQSEGRTHPFSPEFIALAQPYYSVDLRSITFADDINTGSGMSVSFCDRIFFAGHGNLWQDKNELHHVLHELEHTVQCQRRGKRTYLAEYVLKVGADIAKSGRFNVHDIHDYEVAAEAKANQLTDLLWNKIRNGAVPRPGGATTHQGGAGTPQPGLSCQPGEIYMPAPGGACCTPNYSRCRNMTTGTVTCGMYGC